MAIYQLSTNAYIQVTPFLLMKIALWLRRKAIAFQANANDRNWPHAGNLAMPGL